MNSSLPLSNRYVRIGLVSLVILMVLAFVLAPATGQRTSGSTYIRSPEGYLGWFEYMESAGTPVQRWKRPLADLTAQTVADSDPQTLIRIYSGIVNQYQAWDRQWLNEWLAAGNTLIALGVNTRIEDVPFTSRQASPFGEVVVKTRRRQDLAVNSDYNLLGDELGAVVWQQERDDPSGQLYLAATPHLAANAYLNEPGNYPFLADLATRTGGPIWVDEYLHGYREADVVVDEVVNSWGDYLARTPIKIALIQAVILLGIFLIAQNRRLGNSVLVQAAKIDNSRAYIDALAAVLHKARSTSFLVDIIARAERSSLQKALGLNETGVEDTVLAEAWTEQTGKSRKDLDPLLRSPQNPTDSVIKTWLEQLRKIRQTSIR